MQEKARAIDLGSQDAERMRTSLMFLVDLESKISEDAFVAISALIEEVRSMALAYLSSEEADTYEADGAASSTAPNLDSVGAWLEHFSRFYEPPTVASFAVHILLEMKDEVSRVMGLRDAAEQAKALTPDGKIPQPMRVRMINEASALFKEMPERMTLLTNIERFEGMISRVFTRIYANTDSKHYNGLPKFDPSVKLNSFKTIEDFVAYYLRKYSEAEIREVLLAFFEIYHKDNLATLVYRSVQIDDASWKCLVQRYPQLLARRIDLNNFLQRTFAKTLILEGRSLKYPDSDIRVRPEHICKMVVRIHPEDENRIRAEAVYSVEFGGERYGIKVSDSMYISHALEKICLPELAEKSRAEEIMRLGSDVAGPAVSGGSWASEVGEA